MSPSFENLSEQAYELLLKAETSKAINASPDLMGVVGIVVAVEYSPGKRKHYLVTTEGERETHVMRKAKNK